MNTVRSKVLDGFVVKVKIPKNAVMGQVPGTDIVYWQFPVSARGGVVNVFVHTATDVRGQSLACDLKIIKKELDSERWYHHIDLMPTNKRVTHRYVIANEGHHSWPEDAPVVAAGCFNSQARIVIVAKGERLVELDRSNEPAAQQVKTARPDGRAATPKKPSRGGAKSAPVVAAATSKPFAALGELMKLD